MFVAPFLVADRQISKLWGTVAKASSKWTTVQVDRETLTVLDALASETGLSKSELVARLAAWFRAQPVQVQSAITNTRGDAGNEIMKLRLAELAAAEGTQPGPNLTFEQAARVARLMIDRLEQMRRLDRQALAEQLQAETKSGGSDEKRKR